MAMTTNEPIFIQSDLDSLSDYSLQLNQWFLKPIGVWPKSYSTSRVERIVTFILNLISYCSILITVIPCVLQLILDHDDDFRTKLKVLGPLTHWFVGGINYTTLLLRHKEIRYCVKRIQSDWRAVKSWKVHQVMLKDAKFGRSVAAFCAIFMQGGVTGYCVATGFTMEVVRVGNETRTIRMLPCPAYKKLIPVDTSPTNELIFGVQFLAGFIVTSTVVGAFSLAIVFTSHAYGQLDVLMMRITEFVNEAKVHDKNAHWDAIRIIVENHVRILSFISHIEGVMNSICFFELCQCTLAICCLCYYILTEWAEHNIHNLTTYVIILCSVTFNIFIMCYIGEILTQQCNKLADVVYTANWYYLSDKNVLDLMLIIARSNLVTKITAGKVIYLSISTFGDVMKTAFTYFNILLQAT